MDSPEKSDRNRPGTSRSAKATAARGVSIVVDPADPIAAAPPSKWAVGELEDALAGRGVSVGRYGHLSQVPPGDICIVAAGRDIAAAREVLQGSSLALEAVAEACALAPSRVAGRTVLLACGHDARGLVYALLELTDRVRHCDAPLDALAVPKPLAERPANGIRSVARLFTSEVEDKPWFNDRQMWPEYLTLLATQRFNRFQLALGIGYDFLRHVTDGYFLFAYPFLLSVPGYDVRVPQLPAGERERNLDMLRFISEQTVVRGMEFQLGIWMHGYEWIDSPSPNYTIEGLTREQHAPYCRDAVRALLRACPAISGVTFRVHGESGVEEGSYEFWKTVFDGVATCGRTVEIDMHAKGMDQTMIDLARSTRQPVKISPKYWGEHMGMPYHQADIRQLEQPRPGHDATGLMKFSAGSRSFLRYGYGDLLREDRGWGVLHRIWPGTQRLLIWGDPLTAAAHSRAFGFCGSDGVEIMEPLSFKGRRGSGLAGGRCAYKEASLNPRWDWQKYLYTYRVWGRLLYNPAADPDTWRRLLRHQLDDAAPAAEAALANASRILPIVTTAHAASAGNNSYWPELYLNHSMLNADEPGPYRDTPSPHVFGNVSPLDPQLFYRINDFADDLLAGRRGGKYSPIEVAQWIEDYAQATVEHLKTARSRSAAADDPQWRRIQIDATVQAGLGRFFGAKFRGGVLYRLFEQTASRAALEKSLEFYRLARAAWADVVAATKDVYVPNITVGDNQILRGHWADRLEGIDQDIAALTARLDQADGKEPAGTLALAIREAASRPQRVAAPWRHAPAAGFVPGQPLPIELSVEGKPSGVRLHYRHVNHAQRFQTMELANQGGCYHGTIPASYTDSKFPLQYYFEVNHSADVAWLCPGFGEQRVDQPYFVVRPASGPKGSNHD
jgi:hypothetical protein